MYKPPPGTKSITLFKQIKALVDKLFPHETKERKSQYQRAISNFFNRHQLLGYVDAPLNTKGGKRVEVPVWRQLYPDNKKNKYTPKASIPGGRRRRNALFNKS